MPAALAVLAGHSFPRALHSQPDDPYRCRCGLTLNADQLYEPQPPCPMLGVVSTVEQMGASLHPPAPPVVLEGQLSLLDDVSA